MDARNEPVVIKHVGRVALLLAALALINSTALAALTVCQSGCSFTSIQVAIDAAKDGDTIEVQSGTYFEHVDIRKSLNIFGVNNGSGMPLVNASGYGSAITISADNVTLSGFNVTDSGHCGCGNAGISVLSSNNTVTKNVAQGNKYGIRCTGNYNLFMLNDADGNEIDVYDGGLNNTWDEGPGPISYLASIFGWGPKGNHYGDYDQPSEGCLDKNRDQICDSPRNITGGSSVDRYPLILAPKV